MSQSVKRYALFASSDRSGLGSLFALADTVELLKKLVFCVPAATATELSDLKVKTPTREAECLEDATIIDLSTGSMVCWVNYDDGVWKEGKYTTTVYIAA